MKILTVVGARPQFIKAAPVSKALRAAKHTEYLLHTGQHYDHSMSEIFFDDLDIPAPDINLSVGSGPHGWQTGQMLIGIEQILLEQSPDCVLVYGDTNSTLAGALAAVKLGVRVAHVEAGLRSFNRTMPEEHNRILTDHCADLLFCPTQTAVEQLATEGITRGVHWVGDTMYDAVLQFRHLAREKSSILRNLELEPQTYVLATVHRPYNTDNPESLRNILSAFAEMETLVVFPVHPRTKNSIARLEDLRVDPRKVRLVDPVGYLDMLLLEQEALMILTDSGGVQKEAFFLGVPCLTLRPETEWIETVEAGWNQLVPTEKSAILAAVHSYGRPVDRPRSAFGEGNAAQRIVRLLP